MGVGAKIEKRKSPLPPLGAPRGRQNFNCKLQKFGISMRYFKDLLEFINL